MYIAKDGCNMFGNNAPRWGEIYDVDFSQAYPEVGKRPAIVISNDDGNKFSSYVTFAEITKNTEHDLPTHVYLSARYGLRYRCKAQCEHPLYVHKNCIRAFIGSVRGYEAEKRLDKAIRIAYSKGGEKWQAYVRREDTQSEDHGENPE